MKDYYNILGLSTKCSFVDVIKSYNKSINYFNSKLNLSDIDKQTIKELKEAYFVLGNYHNRRKYDNNLEGYKKINEDFSNRIFYRPDLKYQHNIDSKIRSIDSDISNNKKNRIEKKIYDKWN